MEFLRGNWRFFSSTPCIYKVDPFASLHQVIQRKALATLDISSNDNIRLLRFGRYLKKSWFSQNCGLLPKPHEIIVFIKYHFLCQICRPKLHTRANFQHLDCIFLKKAKIHPNYTHILRFVVNNSRNIEFHKNPIQMLNARHKTTYTGKFSATETL